MREGVGGLGHPRRGRGRAISGDENERKKKKRKDKEWFAAHCAGFPRKSAARSLLIGPRWVLPAFPFCLQRAPVVRRGPSAATGAVPPPLPRAGAGSRLPAAHPVGERLIVYEIYRIMRTPRILRQMDSQSSIGYQKSVTRFICEKAPLFHQNFDADVYPRKPHSIF